MRKGLILFLRKTARLVVVFVILITIISCGGEATAPIHDTVPLSAPPTFVPAATSTSIPSATISSVGTSRIAISPTNAPIPTARDTVPSTLTDQKIIVSPEDTYRAIVLAQAVTIFIKNMTQQVAEGAISPDANIDNQPISIIFAESLNITFEKVVPPVELLPIWEQAQQTYAEALDIQKKWSHDEISAQEAYEK